jgi:hypothetical protein
MPEAEGIVIDGSAVNGLRETEDEFSPSHTVDVGKVSFGGESVSPLTTSSFSSPRLPITPPTRFPNFIALLNNLAFSFASG